MKVNPEGLRALIEKDGHTVSSFARESGVNRSHLSNVLAGRRDMSAVQVKKVALTLGVPMSAFTVPTHDESVAVS